jgi:mRNA-degrading endonuclease toxin of MazEF toxin-antitoxin module
LPLLIIKAAPMAAKSTEPGRRLRPGRKRARLGDTLTRESAIGHLSTVTVAPISSTIRSVPSEVILDVDDGMKGRCAVNLHNAEC